MHINLAKSSRFESNDFASVMIDDVGCSRRHQCPQCAFVSHLLTEDQGRLIPSAVAILPVFNGFIPI